MNWNSCKLPITTNILVQNCWGSVVIIVSNLHSFENVQVISKLHVEDTIISNYQTYLCPPCISPLRRAITKWTSVAFRTPRISHFGKERSIIELNNVQHRVGMSWDQSIGTWGFSTSSSSATTCSHWVIFLGKIFIHILYRLIMTIITVIVVSDWHSGQCS